MFDYYYKEREQRLFDYLVKELDSNILINLASHIWISLKMKVWNTSKQILEVPDCCPNPIGSVLTNNDGSIVMFAWDKDEHYLECDINIEGEADFFYRNRLTKETWGYIYNVTNPKFPDSEVLLDKLSYFVE